MHFICFYAFDLNKINILIIYTRDALIGRVHALFITYIKTLILKSTVCTIYTLEIEDFYTIINSHILQ